MNARQYHVFLTDGTEQNYRAQSHEFREGTLVLSNGDNLVVAFPHGEWKRVEAERQDDK